MRGKTCVQERTEKGDRKARTGTSRTRGRYEEQKKDSPYIPDVASLTTKSLCLTSTKASTRVQLEEGRRCN